MLCSSVVRSSITHHSSQIIQTNIIIKLLDWTEDFSFLLWHTLTKRIIRNTKLILCLTPFRLICGIDSTRCWKHSLEMLAHIDRIASCNWLRFVGCSSRAWSSRSTTSQRCSIGWRSGDCGGHFSTVNSLSCSRNQFEMIRDLWHGALCCWKDGYMVAIKGWTWSETMLRLAVAFKQCPDGTKGLKCAKKTSPLHH